MRVVGIDLGGSKARAGLVELNVEEKSVNVVKSFETPSNAYQGPEAVFNALKQCLENVRGECLKVGLGTPGFPYKERFYSAPNLPFLERAVNAFKAYAEGEGLEVRVENDANCFALAENLFGAGGGCRDMAGIIWGTGVGCGLIVNGSLLKGWNSGAGEVGGLLLDPCKSLTWEGVCGGRKMIERYKRLGGSLENPAVSDLLSSNEEAAISVLEDAVRFMALGLATLVKVLNPEAIVFGGGVAGTGLWRFAASELKEALTRSYSEDSPYHCRVEKGVLGSDSGVIGAAALFFHS